MDFLEVVVVWDEMLCNLVDRYQHFGGICCLLFYPEDGGNVFSEMLVPIYQLHGFTSR
jgi:hypothetical protein